MELNIQFVKVLFSWKSSFDSVKVISGSFIENTFAMEYYWFIWKNCKSLDFVRVKFKYSTYLNFRSDMLGSIFF